MVRRIRDWFMHHFNGLHLFCRLCDAGFSMHSARVLAGWLFRK
jgi:hypothetical protein